MARPWAFPLAFLFLLYTVNAASVTVTSPGSNDLFVEGLSSTITWTSSADVPITADVRIDLYAVPASGSGTGTLASIIANAVKNDGSYEWSVPASLDITKTFVVQVTAFITASNYVSGRSAKFSITDSIISLSFKTPTASTRSITGAVTNVTWSATGGTVPNSASLKIELWRHSSSLGESLISTITSKAAGGLYAWTVNMVPAGSLYYLVITWIERPYVTAASQKFTILRQDPGYTVSVPTGPVQAGASVSVDWSAPAPGAKANDLVAVFPVSVDGTLDDYLAASAPLTSGALSGTASIAIPTDAEAASYVIMYITDKTWPTRNEPHTLTSEFAVIVPTYSVSVGVDGSVNPSSTVACAWQAPGGAADGDVVGVYTRAVPTGTDVSDGALGTVAVKAGDTQGSAAVTIPVWAPAGDYLCAYVRPIASAAPLRLSSSVVFAIEVPYQVVMTASRAEQGSNVTCTWGAQNGASLDTVVGLAAVTELVGFTLPPLVASSSVGRAVLLRRALRAVATETEAAKTNATHTKEPSKAPAKNATHTKGPAKNATHTKGPSKAPSMTKLVKASKIPNPVVVKDVNATATPSATPTPSFTPTLIYGGTVTLTLPEDADPTSYKCVIGESTALHTVSSDTLLVSAAGYEVSTDATAVGSNDELECRWTNDNGAYAGDFIGVFQATKSGKDVGSYVVASAYLKAGSTSGTAKLRAIDAVADGSYVCRYIQTGDYANLPKAESAPFTITPSGGTLATATGDVVKNAYAAVRFASAAYGSPSAQTVQAWCRSWPLLQTWDRRGVTAAIYGDTTSLQYFLSYGVAETVQSDWNGFINGSSTTKCVYNGVACGLISKPFSDLYDLVRGEIVGFLRQIASPFSIIVAGHGVGGALATMSAIDLKSAQLQNLANLTAFSFGAPRIGDATFASTVQKLALSLYRVVHLSADETILDIVSATVPKPAPIYKLVHATSHLALPCVPLARVSTPGCPSLGTAITDPLQNSLDLHLVSGYEAEIFKSFGDDVDYCDDLLAADSGDLSFLPALNTVSEYVPTPTPTPSPTRAGDVGPDQSASPVPTTTPKKNAAVASAPSSFGALLLSLIFSILFLRQ